MVPDKVENNTPGYHMVHIEKGKLGELSKIQEELDELKDAHWQGVKIMQAIEISDLLGAIESYVERHLAGITMTDINRMKDVTRRAFKNGHR